MTCEEALEIAMEVLLEHSIDLRYKNKGYEKRIEEQCHRLLTARYVLCNAVYKLTGAKSQAFRKTTWTYLTEEEMLNIVDTYGMQLAEAIEAKLRGKNT